MVVVVVVFVSVWVLVLVEVTVLVVVVQATSSCLQHHCLLNGDQSTSSPGCDLQQSGLVVVVVVDVGAQPSCCISQHHFCLYADHRNLQSSRSTMHS